MLSYWNLVCGRTFPVNKLTRLALAGALFGLSLVSLAAQPGSSAQGKHTKRPEAVTMRDTDPSSGAQMYKEYCAVCHGTKGKGDGPAAGSSKTRPPDLRTLARRHDGKYPTGYVGSMLRSGTGSHADGALDMPVWGPRLRSLDSNAIFEEMRIYNLTAFVESLQEK